MPRVRRTQEERSAVMRGRLLEATIDCLVDLGYGRMTTTAVCDRAGVSRGAQLHHYPTKAQLVTAAVGYLFYRREMEFRLAIANMPPDADKAVAAIDLLWSIFSGRSFAAWLELSVAARTDKELRRHMNRLSVRTTQNVERTFRDLFPAPKQPNPMFDLAPRFAFVVLQGLALEQLAVKDDPVRGHILGILKSLSTLAIPREERKK
jgi:AcrR family transcriptional regulator